MNGSRSPRISNPSTPGRATHGQTVKQHTAAIQMLFSWLTKKEKLAMNPAREATTERPILSKLLENPWPGDILVIWKLDRLGRSVKHLIDVVQRIDDTQDWFEEP